LELSILISPTNTVSTVDQKYLFGLIGAVLIAFALLVWPRLHRYWVIEQADSECIVQMNRVTGHTKAFCGGRISLGWEHYDGQLEDSR
jgi:hypothetical protein